MVVRGPKLPSHARSAGRESNAFLSRGRQTNDLLGGGVGLAEAESL